MPTQDFDSLIKGETIELFENVVDCSCIHILSDTTGPQLLAAIDKRLAHIRALAVSELKKHNAL